MSGNTITFDYISYPASRKPILRPVANLTFEYFETKTSFYALIDSGADYSVSFEEFGRALGIKLDEDAVEDVEGVATNVKAYRHHITVSINGHKVYLDVLWLKKKFDAGRDFPFIIGRQPFFDKFDITFRQSKRKFYLEPVIQI